jgi:ribosomal protein L10
LIAKLVYMLQSPIARFVRGLGAIPASFVRVLEQVRQKKEA